MKTPNDTVYVLSATYQSVSGGGDGSMYIRGTHEFGNDTITDTVATIITEAKVFYSELEAWNYLENSLSGGWQITPISAKKLFTMKLKERG